MNKENLKRILADRITRAKQGGFPNAQGSPKTHLA